MRNDGHVTHGNVLDDLGLNPQSAQELNIKYDLHKQIIALIEKRGYSPRELEKILDVPQPRVSELMRGKLSTLSFSKLLYYATCLGAHPKIVLSYAA
jgi:predicted XRE-type DNA-binding protein